MSDPSDTWRGSPDDLDRDGEVSAEEAYPEPVPDASPVANPETIISADDLRQRALERAASYVGTAGGDHFFDVAAPCYPTPAARKGKSWCQIFWLCCLIEEGVTDQRWRDCVGVFGALPQTKTPKPADTVIFPYTKSDSHVEHGCAFVRREGHWLWTIDGNTTGGVVREKKRDLRVYATVTQPPYFVDMDQWFEAAAARLTELELADTEPPGAA